MPLDPRVQRFLGILAASQPRNALAATPSERRDSLAQLMNFAGPPLPVGGVEESRLPGPGGSLPVRIYTPLGAPPGPLPGLLYFHGGGMVAGSLDTHDSIGRALANSGACRVVSVDYRLAPEHPFPAALDDAIAALRHVSAHRSAFGIDPDKLGICGDSAGGTLAAAATQAWTREGGAPLALQLLLCPILDYGGSSPSRREFANGYLVDQNTLDHDLLHYVPEGIDRCDPRISPLQGSLEQLPRTRIHTAEFDPLRDEGRDYFERLRKVGADVAYTCHPGMIHLFYGLAGVIPYARTAWERIGDETRAAFS